jgi:hypothetical protein
MKTHAASIFSSVVSFRFVSFHFVCFALPLSCSLLLAHLFIVRHRTKQIDDDSCPNTLGRTANSLFLLRHWFVEPTIAVRFSRWHMLPMVNIPTMMRLVLLRCDSRIITRHRHQHAHDTCLLSHLSNAHRLEQTLSQSDRQTDT